MNSNLLRYRTFKNSVLLSSGLFLVYFPRQNIYAKSFETSTEILSIAKNKGLIPSTEFQSEGKILGVISSSDNKPIKSATVQIKGFPAVQTDDKGQFLLANIPDGKYILEVSRVGFDQARNEISISQGGSVTINITLNNKSQQLGEVVVTASRVAESINEVPSSITYIGPKDLELQRQINDNLPNMLMQKVPSISPSEESQNNFIAKIRGRNFLVLIDGVPQSTPLRNGGRDLRAIDPSAIDHIEVINGASAMYGNGAAGGIVNYITKKAVTGRKLASSTYFNNSISPVKASETYGYNLSQVFSGELDKFEYLVQGKIAKSGVVRSSDKTIVSPFYGLGETDSYNALAKIKYNFNENHQLEIMGNYYRSIQDSKYVGTVGNYGVSPAIGVPSDTVINGGTPYNKALNLKYDGKFGKTNANLSLYYEDMNTVFETYNQTYSDHTGARLNFNTPFSLSQGNELTLIYGVDLLKDHTVQKTMKDDLLTPDMNMNSMAYYVQSKFNLFEHWILKAGVRYEALNFKVSDLIKNGKTTAGEKDNSSAFVFNIGARYNKLSYLQPFVSFSQGFSIGDVGLILRNGVPLSSIDPKPVKVNNFEAGINGKYGIFDYQLTGYYSSSKKGTTFAEVGAPGNYELAQVPQRIYGLEAVANSKPIDWLKVGLTLGIMDGRQDLKNEGKFKDKLDNSIISPLKINFNADFSITDQWNVYAQMLHIGKRDVFPVDEYNYGKYPITGYTLFDLSTGYKFKNITFNLSVSNIFNRNYYPIHAEVRGATNEGRYYIKGSGALANLGITMNL